MKPEYDELNALLELAKDAAVADVVTSGDYEPNITSEELEAVVAELKTTAPLAVAASLIQEMVAEAAESPDGTVLHSAGNTSLAAGQVDKALLDLDREEDADSVKALRALKNLLNHPRPHFAVSQTLEASAPRMPKTPPLDRVRALLLIFKRINLSNPDRDVFVSSAIAALGGPSATAETYRELAERAAGGEDFPDVTTGTHPLDVLLGDREALEEQYAALPVVPGAAEALSRMLAMHDMLEGLMPEAVVASNLLADPETAPAFAATVFAPVLAGVRGEEAARDKWAMAVLQLWPIAYLLGLGVTGLTYHSLVADPAVLALVSSREPKESAGDEEEVVDAGAGKLPDLLPEAVPAGAQFGFNVARPRVTWTWLGFSAAFARIFGLGAASYLASDALMAFFLGVELESQAAALSKTGRLWYLLFVSLATSLFAVLALVLNRPRTGSRATRLPMIIQGDAPALTVWIDDFITSVQLRTRRIWLEQDGSTLVGALAGVARRGWTVGKVVAKYGLVAAGVILTPTYTVLSKLGLSKEAAKNLALAGALKTVFEHERFPGAALASAGVAVGGVAVVGALFNRKVARERLSYGLGQVALVLATGFQAYAWYTFVYDTETGPCPAEAGDCETQPLIDISDYSRMIVATRAQVVVGGGVVLAGIHELFRRP